MGDNLDKVFVALWDDRFNNTIILNWALDYFDKDKTKFILTYIYKSAVKNIFLDTARGVYLPKCAEKKFTAEILITDALGKFGEFEAPIKELITKHGMNKLVIYSYWISHISEVFGKAPNISCKVWFVTPNGKLSTTRLFNPEVAHEEKEKENEKLKKMLKEETSRYEKVEKELLSMTEQEKINAQEINCLRHEIDQQKQEASRREEEILKKIEKGLLSMTEQAKINAQEIDRLRHEIEQQKQEASRREEEILKKIEKGLLLMPDYLKLQDEHALRSNFTVEDIKQATQNFSDLLIVGKGAYGIVYKGYLGGTNVAIKILNPQCKQGVLGFKQEVAILTTCRHPNLVTLMGACYETSALIYEFLPNGSLEDHLSGKNNNTPLTWQVRTRIMCEICIALNFLHSNKPNMIIHGDLKPDNILLDANFTSKLGDFGISHIIERSNTNTTLHYSTCNPIGTYLYIDPEYAYSGKLTEKSDVFSFGIIILRLLTGKSTQGVVSGVEEAMEDGKLDKMIDVSAGEWPFDQAKELAMLGLRCAEIRRIDRPNLFKEVWPILESLQRNI